MASSPFRLLLVEDEPSHVAAIERAFATSGAQIEIQVVATLREFRAAVAARLPDLAIMDLNLPDGSAVEVLVAPPETGLFPILAVTSYGDEQVAVEAIKAGALDYIVKSPEAFAAMPQTVARALREWRLLQAHREAETALRESEQRFRAVTHSANDAIIVADGDGIILDWNRGAGKIFGYTEAEAVGHPLTLLLPPRYQDAHSHGMLRLQAGGAPQVVGQTVELVGRRKDGSEFPLELSLAEWTTASGRFYASIIRDITERKRATEALRQSEAQFRAIFEMASVGIAQADIRTGQWLRVNQKMCAITGYSADELLRMHISQITHPDDRPSDWKAFQRVVRGEQPDYRMEKRYVRKDGSLVWVNVNMTVIRDAAGQPTRTVAMIEDITWRKQAEEALRQSETELQVTLEATADGILAVDNQGKVVKTNRRFAEFWRIPPSLVENHDDQAMLAFVLNQLSEPEAFLKKVQALYGSDVVDLDTIAFKDGRVFERYSAPMLMAGRITGRVWSFRDITERRRLEAQVAETYLQLIATSRQAGMAEFATGILHNVGNVLNSVGVASTCVADILRKSKSANLAKTVALLREHQDNLGDFLTHNPRGKLAFAYLAQLSDLLAAEQAVVLQELAGLQKNIAHIKDVVLTQQSMAKVSGAPEALKLTELVEDAVRMNGSSLARQGIQIIRQFEEVPPFAIEKNKVLQILVNLVRNAEQAYVNPDHQGKTLTLRVTRKQDRVRVAVSDNGVGIPPEDLERIFTRGFTTKKDGHGFGLCNCVTAAGEMGGSLTVHSDGPGRGACFTLELPCHLPEVVRE